MELLTFLIISSVIVAIILILLSGIRIVRPMEKATIERLGKYKGFAKQGFNWIIPAIDRIVVQDITERMIEVEPFEAITKERLNLEISLVVFYKVKEDEESVKCSLYKVDNFKSQVVRISQTTARSIIGTMAFEAVNSKRGEINKTLKTELKEQCKSWGVEIARVETKEITPPKSVQESMNGVIIAENKKTSAVNNAVATETEADGKKKAEIKKAEGEKQASILKAEGQSEAFKLINKSFTGNAKILRSLEVTENSLRNNSKIILTEKGINPQIILGDIPIKSKKE